VVFYHHYFYSLSEFIVMNKLYFLNVMIASSVYFNIGYVKENPSWSDYLQDATQTNSPVEYIDTYNKYSVISPILK